jgi:hypothetical protein
MVALVGFWGYSFIHIMKKFFTVFFLVSSLLIILNSFNFGYGLVTFFFAGIIPGTTLQLTPEQMLVLYIIAVAFVVIRLKPQLLRKLNLTMIRQNRSKTRKLKHV